VAKVILKPGESLEEALRRFRRFVLKEGIVKEQLRRRFYEKPSEAKKRKRSMRKKKAEFERARGTA